MQQLQQALPTRLGGGPTIVFHSQIHAQLLYLLVTVPGVRREGTCHHAFTAVCTATVTNGTLPTAICTAASTLCVHLRLAEPTLRNSSLAQHKFNSMMCMFLRCCCSYTSMCAYMMAACWLAVAAPKQLAALCMN